ncbi:hypothetical protein PAESOLCIP111_03094 [Paenibacillus solanacearum]|uniref:Uncharacterized protein n=1 Tax=Paenibacillus solanacearum TaxID=2048548 RepID=A0A916K3C7_9BACL|nr:hypothetical protein [Paenibacillus solanacearum]CAG7629348.1 hypothetical protein PAESOLCIP111_03094 [Paenibacillus solanacearum]
MLANGGTGTDRRTGGIGPVPAPDFRRTGPEDFADEDYIAPQVWVHDRRGIPYYYKHFHTVANKVRLEGPHRGFIDIVVHRSPEHNQPYNARVQENHLWLAYFYTNRSRWNMYYGMPEVKHRLEAVLEHLLTLQSPQGAFSEYGWEQYNLPGTSFTLQFLGQTVRLLEEARAADPGFPFIDEKLYDSVIEASRKGIVHVLRDGAFWKHGTGYTNQYTLIWSASAAYLAYRPDAGIETSMKERYRQASAAFISPAGFYYENNGFDMNYNVGVHIQNMMADYHYFKDTPMEQEMIAKESRFIEWLSYNLVLEPDGSFFTSNAAASGRTASSHYERKDIPLAEKLPQARAFVRTREEVAAEIAEARRSIAKDGMWPHVPELALTGGNAYNPYGLYNRIMYRYAPTEAERAEAVARLPYRARDRFNHQRIDDRSGLQFTYVRRPDYYAAFNAGPHRAKAQSFGLGLLWHPAGGIMLSSQTEHPSLQASRGLSWGTRSGDGSRVYESGDVIPAYAVRGEAQSPAAGFGDLAEGDLEIKYALGADGAKTLHFGEDGIFVDIRHPARFEERIPLMIAPEDRIAVGKGQVVLQRGTAMLCITFDEAAEARLVPQSFGLYRYQLQMLTLGADETLTYTMKMKSLAD